MKKSILAFCATAAALLLAGCQKENINVVETAEATHTVVFTAEKMVDTKTAIASEGDKTVSYKWTAGDEARMYITETYASGENTVTNTGTVTDMTLSNEDKTATFTVSFSGNAPTGDITYRAVYGGSFSDDHNPLIPAAQSPRADSFDPNADVMVGVVNRTARDENPTSIRFNMERKVSVNKMTLKGLKKGEVVKSVTFESDKTHSTYFLVSSGSYDTDAANCSNKLTFNFISNNTVPSSGEFPVYFTTAPVEGASFTVNVVTNLHRYSKPSTKAITFKTGEVRRFGVTLPAGQDIDPIEGDYLIGAYVGNNNSKWFVMTPVLGGSTNNYFQKLDTDITKGVSTIDYSDFSGISGIENCIWRIEAYGEGYSIRSTNTNDYLYYYPGNSPSNEARASSELSEHTCFNVTIENKLATIQSRENSSRVLRYNSGQPRFAFYGGTQNDIYLIPVYDDGLRPVTLSFTDSAINTDTNDYTNVTGQTVAVSPNESAISNAITYSMAGDPIGSVDSSTGSVTLNGTAGVATVTATFFGDATYRATTAEYTITVVQIDNVMYKIVKSIDDVTEGTYVIVNYGHYLPNAAATNAGPIMNDNTKVTILGDYVINVTGDMTWDFTGTTSAMTIKSTIAGNYYLIVSGAGNNNVRVNTTSGNTWSIYSYPSSTSAFYMKDNTNNRFCATTSNGDWRSYNSYNSDYYGDGGQIYLYKEIDTRDLAPISWSSETASVSIEGSTITWTEPSGAQPNLTNTENLTVTYASSVPAVATINDSGVLDIVGEGTTEISASYAGNVGDPYASTKVSYTLTVVDNTTYLITVTQPSGDVSGFTIAASPSGSQKAGTTIDLSFSGSVAGYTFANWDVYETGNSNNKVTVTDDSFTMPKYPVTVTATFLSLNDWITEVFPVGTTTSYAGDREVSGKQLKWYLHGTCGRNDSDTAFDFTEALTMGKSADNSGSPANFESSPIANGISKLKFDYIGNGKAFKVEVVVNGSVVWSRSGFTATATKQSSGELTVTNATSNASIRFVNTSGERRVTIGNISWK